MLKSSVFFLIGLGFASSFALAATLPAPDFMAITDNPVIRNLESQGLSISDLLNPTNPLSGKASNLEMYESTEYATIVDDIATHLERIRKGDPASGTGMKYGHRLFDVGFLKSNLARLVLVGAVLRMDRAFLDPDSCGEFRLIYRLSYRVKLNGEDVASRLPMSMNLVFNAKNKVTAQVPTQGSAPDS